MVHTSEQANKPIDEKSPYLLQHAYNPVDWYHHRIYLKFCVFFTASSSFS